MYSRYSVDSHVISPADPSLHVNGVQYEIPRDCGPELMLIDFLRDVLELKGSKVSCREAACGCCIVCATYQHPGTGEVISKPVNSCLTPLYSTIGWHVTTVEGLGGKKSGYHPIQARLADNYGSQCGYCSPGFVMSMFSQLQANPKPTEAEVEHFFDGNICRCTGYRPILDSMKTFARDCKATKGTGCLDIEDIQSCCQKSAVQKIPTSGITPVARGWRGQRFYNPGSLDQLLELLQRMRGSTYRLLVGNTSAGVFKDDALAEFYVNIRNVPELYEVKESSNGDLEIGACLTIADLMELFGDVAGRVDGLRHLGEVAKHYQVVGSQAVRRNGSWAGNLMMKHAHPGMGSDIFITFEASRARLKIADGRSVRESTLIDFLQTDMRGCLILSAVLPAMSTRDHVFKSFKITQRVLHSHAYVNAAFHFAVDKKKKHLVTDKPSILYGGISGKFNHAAKTENFLQNKSLCDPDVVSGAMEVLQSELVPAENPTLSSQDHRRSLAVNLLYKFVLAVCADSIEPASISGGLALERPTQHTEVSYAEEMQGTWLGKAMPKQEARAQTSGEAMFVADFKAHRQELFMAFVLAPEAPARLLGFGTEDAEKVPGYRRLVTAADLKDKYINTLTFPMLPIEAQEPEELLVTEKISYSGQQVALVLAASQWSADEAASLVEVRYEQTGEPVLGIRDAIAKGSIAQEGHEHLIGEASIESALNAPGAIHVEGEVLTPEQTHFPIENLTASAEISEEGLLVTAPHQWVELMALHVSRILRRPISEVRAVSPRVGGGFGGKLNMSDLVASAVSVCADLTGQPVRTNLTTSTVLKMTSKRGTKLLCYRAACDSEGHLLAVDWDLKVEVGYVNNINGLVSSELQEAMDMGFYAPSRRLKFTNYHSNKPCTTFVRSPGSAPASVGSLMMLDHLAHEAGIDPIQFKRTNLYQPGQTDMLGKSRSGDSLTKMWDQLYERADVRARLEEIETFNRANRYRKRGLDMSAASYFVSYNHFRPAVVKINILADGTVSVNFSASEIGQGIGVKIAQAVASTLKVDIALVKMKPSDSQVTPNGNVTGGSIASEWCCQAAIDAANQLNASLEPIRQADPASADNWVGLVQKAIYMGASLTAIGSFLRRNDEGKGAQYYTNGICVAEAEVDILTGVYHIRRVDLLVDVGKSLNPGVDIGQIEGAFVMGMGYCLTERTIYDPDSGKNLCDGTWNYKVPQAADTPRDFRVHLLEQSTNSSGLLNTRAIGEPPVCLAPVCLTAIKRAIEAFRRQEGKPNTYLVLELPLNPENVLLLCEVGEKERRLRLK